MGSKNRIAKDILPILLNAQKGRIWVEPFVGGGNIIDKVSGTRIGFDLNANVIQALVSIRDHVDELPKNNSEFTEQDYNNLKTSDAYPHKGYAGFAFSYGGKWMGGWARSKDLKRDYVAEAYRNALKQSPRLQGVSLFNLDYTDIELSDKSFIYCDPPYKNTTEYKGGFDHDKFWNWVRLQYKEGHIVYVSEYEAPEDFECVWSKKITSSLTQNTGDKNGIEKLFRLVE